MKIALLFLKLSIIALIVLISPCFCVAAGSGPEIVLDIVSIERTETGFLVKGNTAASGLNPEGQIVESDTVSIYADIQEGPESVYQKLPEGMYIRYPAGAETLYTPGSGPGNTMTREESDGIDILAYRVAEYGLRNTPVWRAYGGLGVWEDSAPASVSSDFQGIIPLEYEGKKLRIRASLKHEWGGPYANWPAFSFHHDIGYEDVLTTMGDVPPDPEPDPEPDPDDMCPDLSGSADFCGCPNTDIIPGDLIFRYAKPAYGSWYAGYAEVEGKKYNFGHVAVYAGDFRAQRSYKVRHANGVDVQRLNSDTQLLETIHLTQGELIQPDDIINDAVIEGDKGYGGVGISNLSNFRNDHDGTLGSSADGIMYGQPPAGLKCRQRKLILDQMAQFAAETDDGTLEYGIWSTNCAWSVGKAYTLAGQNLWQQFVDSDETGTPNFVASFWHKLHKFVGSDETWTPNFVASWMLLSHFGEPRPGLNPTATAKPTVSIVVKSPADLHLYDSRGRHTGATAEGIESNIPYSEYWVYANGHKVINLFGDAGDTYHLVADGYADGTVQFEIIESNFIAPEQAHDFIYQPIVFTPQTSGEISLDPHQSLVADNLSLAIDFESDGQVDQYEIPFEKCAYLKDCFGSHSVNNWVYGDYGSWYWSDDEKLGIHEIPAEAWAIAEVEFSPPGFFSVDVDYQVVSASGSQDAIAIYPFASLDTFFLTDGRPVDGVAAVVQLASHRMHFIAWDIAAGEWISMEQYAIPEDASSFGLSYAADGVIFRCQGEDTEIKLTGDFSAAESSVDNLWLMAMGSGTEVLFDNLCATPLKSINMSSGLPTSPENLSYILDGSTLTLNWDPVPGANGYRLRLGMVSEAYGESYDMGNVTQFGPLNITDIPIGTYYLAIDAYGNGGTSDHSNEIVINWNPALSIGQVENLHYAKNGNTFTLFWDEVTGASGYQLFLGMESGHYGLPADLGYTTQLGPLDITDVPVGTYYLSVRAYRGTAIGELASEVVVPVD